MIDLVEELHYGANILLGYFHYCTKGFHPFSLANAEKTLSMAELTAEQVEFVKRTAAHVKANGKFCSSSIGAFSANDAIRVSVSRDV